MKKLPPHLKTGRKGEKLALKQLRRQGYLIIDKNIGVHNKGEIDIIALDGQTICFVEVKTRHQNIDEEYNPISAINDHKRSALSKTALHYLKKKQLLKLPFRFDAVEVYLNKLFWKTEIHIYRDLFNLKK